jgi:hypothetical protein
MIGSISMIFLAFYRNAIRQGVSHRHPRTGALIRLIRSSLSGAHLTSGRNHVKLRRVISKCQIIFLLATSKLAAGFPRNISG